MEGGTFSPSPEDTGLGLLGRNQGYKSLQKAPSEEMELLGSLQDEGGRCEQTLGCVILAAAMADQLGRNSNPFSWILAESGQIRR